MTAAAVGSQFQPNGARVLVRPHASESIATGGIHRPEIGVRKPWRGTVIAVGPGRVTKRGVRCPIPLSVGDAVIFARGLGVEIEHDGAPALLMAEDAILGTELP